MALREREVKGYVVDGDGVPLQNAKVKFKPTSTLGYTSTHVVVDREFEAITDNDGYFSRTLWCDEDSLVAINYNVCFPIVNNGQADSLHIANFSLAYQDGTAIDIGTLIAMGIPSPPPLELLYQSIDSRISTWLLTGLGAGTNTPIAATDTILQAFAKLQNQITNGGGGMSIGEAVGGATDFAALFVDVNGNLAQDAADYYYDPATSSLFLKKITNPAYSGSYIEFVAGGTNLWFGSVNYINITGYGIYYGGDDHHSFYLNQVEHFKIGETESVFNAVVATKVPLAVKLAASQTADAFPVKNSAGTVITAITASGAFSPAVLANADAPNNSIYYSTDDTALCYKDDLGGVNRLY